jgi:hypothetical protein
MVFGGGHGGIYCIRFQATFFLIFFGGGHNGIGFALIPNHIFCLFYCCGLSP